MIFISTPLLKDLIFLQFFYKTKNIDYFYYDKKYCSSEYISLYNQAEKVANGDLFLDVNHWVASQDCDKPKVINVKVTQINEKTAEAHVKVKLFENFEGERDIKLVLIYENDSWVIDDFRFTLGEENFSEKEFMKEYITENKSRPNDLSWLQGHWVYRQGNYEGHFVIEGNRLSMYSTMNPSPLTYNYRVDGDELIAGEMTVKIDKYGHRIDYGSGNWMQKIK